MGIFKYISFVVLFLCISLNTFSQQRVNGSKHYKLISSSQIVTLPVGWYYDSEIERWIGYYGIISADYKNNHNVPKKMTANEMSGYDDKGIYSLQIKKVRAGEKNYYLLYHVFWSGAYDYPALEVGWRYWKDTRVYIINEEEYNKFLNPQIGINKIKIMDWVGAYDLGLFKGENAVNLNLNSTFKDIIACSDEKPYHSPWSDYAIFLKLEEDGKTTRFQLPSDKLLWSEAQEINAENERKKMQNKYYHYYPIEPSKCVNFDKEYFEFTPQQYNSLKLK